ncbi:MAG: D-alanine--D-alanine ligase, partial [Natronospirillum sp.]
RAFISLHGRGGEDGCVQAVLEALGIPYAGSGVAASAIGMNKLLTKLIWQASGLPTADSKVLADGADWAAILASLGGKAVLKPVLEGSSIGISIVDTAANMAAGYRLASQFNSQVLAERFIDGPEYTVAILGTTALPVIRLQAEEGFYDYAAKYEREDTHYFLPSGLTAEEETDLQTLSLAAFQVLGCVGWGRIDAMRDRDGGWWLLEVNTIPGLTSHSLVPMAAHAAGLSLADLAIRILQTVEVPG